MTTILTKCPNPQCNQAGKVPEQYLGRTVKCQSCGQAFKIAAVANADAPPAPRPAKTVLRAWKPAEIILGDYRVERALGEGTLGTAYLLSRAQSAEDRFAVKQVKFADPTSGRTFVQALQTWLDLPVHPHLAACRFYRALDDGALLFNEYVDGEPLSAWITQRKLNQLPDILDVALQFAWGLHAAHEQGIVHMHVKPSNVLLTPEKVVKVSDAGLAQTQMSEFGSKAMTSDYCSPEQSAGQLLTRTTDVWSWAVCVLEMFTGEVAWLNGTLAGETLEGFLAYPPDDHDLPAIPKMMAELLRLCFRKDPKTRPTTFLSIAEALTRIYKKATGQPYPRPAPAFSRRAAKAPLADGVTCTAPRIWLESALQSAGRDPAKAEKLIQAAATLPSDPESSQAELAIFAQAQTIYEELLKRGRSDLEVKFANLCLEAAIAHEHAADATGALPLYKCCLPVYERLLRHGKRRELEPVLADIYLKNGMALLQQETPAEAVAMFDRYIAIRELPVHQEGRRDLEPGLAMVYFQKAVALDMQEDAVGAISMLNRCIALYERQVQEEGQHEGDSELAVAYLRKSETLKKLGDQAEVESLYAQCIPLFERLVHEQDRRELAPELAVLYTQQGRVLETREDPEGAAELYDRCIVLYEQLVNQDKRTELEPELAAAYMNKANVLQSRNELPGAIELYERCIDTYGRLLCQQGRYEFEPDLAMAYLNQGIALEAQGELEKAVCLYDLCCGLNEQLVLEEGRLEFTAEWIKAQLYVADAYRQLGEVERARQLANPALQMLDNEIQRTNNQELYTVRNWARKNLRQVL